MEAKYVKERKIPLEGDYPWSKAISQYGELAASKFKCLTLNKWKRGISRKRERERPQEDKVKKKEVGNYPPFDDLLNGKVTLEELKEKSDCLSNFFGSRKEFLVIILDRRITRRWWCQDDWRRFYSPHWWPSKRLESWNMPNKRQIIQNIPCMVNGITTQALCDSGACGIDAVSKTFLNKATPETNSEDLTKVFVFHWLINHQLCQGRKFSWRLTFLEEEKGIGLSYLTNFHQRCYLWNPIPIKSQCCPQLWWRANWVSTVDGYVKGISHLNSSLIVMPGLTHLRFDHVRQIYAGWIEIMNIGNTSFSLNTFMSQKRMQNKLWQNLLIKDQLVNASRNCRKNFTKRNQTKRTTASRGY